MSLISMEGMIWNANQTLEAAMSSKYNGIPKAFFDHCAGIVLMQTIETGLIFSANVGTGIIFRRKEDGSWSAPSACGLSGLGFGFVLGSSLKDLIIFLMDESTFEGYIAKHGIKLGTQSEITIGPLGRSYQFDSNVSKQNFGPTVAVGFSKGLFGGLHVKGGVLGVRDKVNEKFYNQKLDPKEILYGEPRIPTDKFTMLDEVYAKLDKLSRGILVQENEAKDEDKIAKAFAAAEAAGAEAKSDPDVVEVDAKTEASKESS